MSGPTVTPPTPPTPPRPSGSQTVVGLKAFAATPTVSEKTTATAAAIGAVLGFAGLALLGFVAYGVLLKGTTLSTTVTLVFLGLGALLVLGGAYAIAPDKTKALVGILEGVGQDLHLPFMKTAP